MTNGLPDGEGEARVAAPDHGMAGASSKDGYYIERDRTGAEGVAP